MARVVNRARKAASVTLPAPTLGINSRDAWADMDPRFATAMVNMFPKTNSVSLRKGYTQQEVTWVSGGTQVMQGFKNFIKYGDTSLWGAWRRTTSPAVELLESLGGTEVTSFGAGQSYAGSTQFSNSGGTYVVVAGQEYWTYDGTTWTDNTVGIGGLSTLAQVATFRGRLWFTKISGLSVWYLPTAAIIGALVELPLGGVAKKGGSVTYIGTWTLDGGAGGLDDRIVFITSNGEVIVYEGYDPSSAATFSLVGVFDVSKPIAPPIKYGSDLLLVCSDGLYSLTEITRGNSSKEYAISDLIRADWQAAAAGAAFSISGVSAAYSPKLNCIVVNFPTTAEVSSGFQASIWWVMNTITKAWTKFTGLDAGKVIEFQGDIYFANINNAGTSSYIGLWGTAGADNGNPIVGYTRQAYSKLGIPGSIKQVAGILPSFRVGGAHTVGVLIERDYRNELSTSSTPTNETGYSTGSYRPMLSYPVIGEALAPFFEASSSASDLDWFSTTLLVSPGGIV